MNDGPPVFTQFDISAGSVASGANPALNADPNETHRLLRDMVALQTKSCELLTELVNQVSLQQRQRVAELKAWKEANPELAASCRQAAVVATSHHSPCSLRWHFTQRSAPV